MAIIGLLERKKALPIGRAFRALQRAYFLGQHS
jgi:hypothetical protein